LADLPDVHFAYALPNFHLAAVQVSFIYVWRVFGDALLLGLDITAIVFVILFQGFCFVAGAGNVIVLTSGASRAITQEFVQLFRAFRSKILSQAASGGC